MKLTPIYKFILTEQENIEPIGGEITSPNEFAYFDFKSWAYEFGTKELFREKKFKASNGIEYTLEEATEMGAGQLFDILTQIWKLWASETGDSQFGRIKDENVQEFGKALYNMMKEDGKGFFFKGDERGAKVGDDAEYLKQRFGVEMNELTYPYPQEQGPSYDEVWLKDKLGDPTKDKHEFDVNRGRMTIYPDLGDMRAERSSQVIIFKLEEGTIHFVHAFGYERGYDMLKKAVPELGPMGDSSYAGFMNVNTDYGTIPMDIDTANKMIDALRSGLDAEATAQTDFYSSRGPTSGTIDEIEITEEEARQIVREILLQGIPINEAAQALAALPAILGRALAAIGQGVGRAAAGTGKALARGASRVATGARNASTKYGKKAKSIAKDYAKDYAKDKAIDAAVDKLIPPGDEDKDDGVHDHEFDI